MELTKKIVFTCLILGLIVASGCRKDFSAQDVSSTSGQSSFAKQPATTPTPSPTATSSPVLTPTPTATPITDQTVWVYKSDNSTIDSVTEGITLDVGASAMYPNKILAQKKVRDMSLYGTDFTLTDSGIRNAYQINTSEFSHASLLGYQKMNSEMLDEVDCSSLTGNRTMIVLALGQSNGSNVIPVLYKAKHAVYNFYGGHCYPAQDPMLGTSASAGNVWSRVGDAIVEAGLADRVIFVTIAVGGSGMSSWIPGGANYPKVTETLTQMSNSGLEFTHIFWHQGETDGALKTSPDFYIYWFLTMLNDMRSRGLTAPIYVSVATYMIGQVNTDIQNAQKNLVNESLKIRSGPNTDTLGASYRQSDNVHFNELGANTIAQMWVNLL